MTALAAAIAAVLALLAGPLPEGTTMPAAVYQATTPGIEARLAHWDDLAACESTGNWAINTGNGFYGGVQFHPTSWRAVGGTGLPHEWSRIEQVYRAELLYQLQGAGAWPGCRAAFAPLAGLVPLGQGVTPAA